MQLSDGTSLRAVYLAGCDGGRSVIRKAAGIEFLGWDPSTSSLIAEVEMSEEPQWGIRDDDKSAQAWAGWRTGSGQGWWSVSGTPQTGEPTLRALRCAAVRDKCRAILQLARRLHPGDEAAGATSHSDDHG